MMTNLIGRRCNIGPNEYEIVAIVYVENRGFRFLILGPAGVVCEEEAEKCIIVPKLPPAPERFVSPRRSVPNAEELAYFRREWETLANQGKCDAIDGAEYRRKLAEWVSAGFPSDVSSLIIR